MTVVCIECDRYTFQDKEMARNGFGRCRSKGVGEFQSPEWARECVLYIASPSEKVSEGRAYLENIRIQRGKTYGKR